MTDEIQSRSVQKRKAIQRGEPMPVFVSQADGNVPLKATMTPERIKEIRDSQGHGRRCENLRCQYNIGRGQEICDKCGTLQTVDPSWKVVDDLLAEVSRLTGLVEKLEPHKRLAELLDDLCVCYRMKTRPSDQLLDEILKVKAKIARPNH